MVADIFASSSTGCMRLALSHWLALSFSDVAPATPAPPAKPPRIDATNCAPGPPPVSRAAPPAAPAAPALTTCAPGREAIVSSTPRLTVFAPCPGAATPARPAVKPVPAIRREASPTIRSCDVSGFGSFSRSAMFVPRCAVVFCPASDRNGSTNIPPAAAVPSIP